MLWALCQFIFLFFYLMVLGIEPRFFCILGKHHITVPCPQVLGIILDTGLHLVPYGLSNSSKYTTPLLVSGVRFPFWIWLKGVWMSSPWAACSLGSFFACLPLHREAKYIIQALQWEQEPRSYCRRRCEPEYCSFWFWPSGINSCLGCRGGTAASPSVLSSCPHCSRRHSHLILLN